MKTVSSPEKIMVTIIWDEDGKVNSERCVKVLRKLKQAIKKKRPGLNTTNITLHHVNARPHTAHIFLPRELQTWDGRSCRSRLTAQISLPLIVTYLVPRRMNFVAITSRPMTTPSVLSGSG